MLLVLLVLRLMLVQERVHPGAPLLLLLQPLYRTMSSMHVYSMLLRCVGILLMTQVMTLLQWLQLLRL